MKIIVTGAAGFIGANMTEFLLAQGYEVIGIDNFNDYYPREIKEFNIANSRNNPNFKLYEVDIVDLNALQAVFDQNKVDAIVHLAARAGVTPSVKNPHIYATNNYLGTDNMALMAVKYGVKNFIFASTSSVYGNKNKAPFTENMETSFPESPYPASKKSSEVLLYTYQLNHDINVTIFRFFNPLGKYQRPDTAMPKLIKAAIFGYEFPLFQDPKQQTARDYTDVIEMCKAIEAAIKNPFKYEIFNLGNSNPETLQTLLSTVEEVTGRKINTVEEMRPGQMEITYANIDKARDLLGYKPSLSLRDIIVMYYEWFMQQPDWYQKMQING